MTAGTLCLLEISPESRGNALHRKSYECNELKNMFREVAVYNLGSGPVLQLTDIPSSNNIFCPRPTWRWRDTPELSCRHDERGKDFRDGATAPCSGLAVVCQIWQLRCVGIQVGCDDVAAGVVSAGI
ncbi:hypothetical protein DVH24_018437 [Malus domestica]|uniref:Uncharacterized protein n=1 Tax=Malus domestica TaxID=3750 RepID=A0A498KKV0_MALDO|nr:hypothetical protein DVH24_018437 [Malus domestica]